MMKRGKKVLGMVLAFAVLIGCNATTAKAAGIEAKLESNDTVVTVTALGISGSTIAYVTGYEIHSQTGDVHYYNQQRSTSVSGTATLSFGANTGYKFQLNYQSVPLKARIVVSGSWSAETDVRR